MKRSCRFLALCTIGLASGAVPHSVLAEKQIPEPLLGWEDWVTWEDAEAACPRPYDDGAVTICVWPRLLTVNASADAGAWTLDVDVFAPTWVPLPGGGEIWPFQVRTNDGPVAVVDRGGQPAVRLPAGNHTLTGTFYWDRLPQYIQIPREIGLLTLVLEGTPIPLPNWDGSGRLWLRRLRTESTAEDQLTRDVYRVLEDGIPLWLRTEIELSVSGKSREEDLGWVLPAGWTPSRVESPIPVAVDDEGRMKAQVRAGKWRILLHAFQTSDVRDIGFAEEATPTADRELIAFQANPEFRMAELEGLTPVDVSQTSFPAKWRGHPVFEWYTDSGFQLVEKMRGMGARQPQGLTVYREMWLDEDGRALTFRDRIQGQMQQIWRLDIADGQELGAVRVNGQSQLITANPNTDAHGVEIRARDLRLRAIGRIPRAGAIPAIGWQANADGLGMKLHLPPGWRLLALFGVDWVNGDWLTTWSLLDLFLLLIFTLAVFKLWGWQAGLVAFFAFGLSYHEPGAPRFSWLFLLMPLALLRVVTDGPGRRWAVAWRFLAVGVLVVCLVPFVATQIQSAIYPQLERRGISYQPRGLMGAMGKAAFGTRSRQVVQISDDFDLQAEATLGLNNNAPTRRKSETAPASRGVRFAQQLETSNLWYEPMAKIQTGPAEPVWGWNWVQCGWNGPVAAEQAIRPILISPPAHRILTVVRLLLLIALAGLLLGVRKVWNPFPPRAAAAAAATALVLLLGAPNSVEATTPGPAMLDQLRSRLLETSDAYPNAASLSVVNVRVGENRILMEAEIHCAVATAVPLPGRLPAWSPVSVIVNGQGGTPLRRGDGFLWAVLPEGVNRVSVEGALPNATEWEWAFRLKPKRVRIDAPGWQVSGIRANGVPEDQVFFTQQRDETDAEAAYDRTDFSAVLAVDRHLEIGLQWQVRTVVSRLSPSEKAVSVRIPLLPGEKVLSSGVVVSDRAAEVRLGAGQSSFQWNSELPIQPEIQLEAATTVRWIERWHLVTSPVWHVAISGGSPVFESRQKDLVPVWRPWPGEATTLAFSKPTAVTGQTVTVKEVRHHASQGSRQRTSSLTLQVECSLGEDFLLTMDPDAQITSLTLDDQVIPVRRDGGVLIVPVRPGSQTLKVEWRTDDPMRTRVRADEIALPVDSANITTSIRMPESRWILWSNGPLRGPAVRFWTILICAIMAAWVLGSLRLSPIGRLQWTLLALGLTQVHLAAALLVVGWFFLLAWRGKRPPHQGRPWRFDLMQISLIGVSAAALGVLILVVREGLLGTPEMFIRGNGSSYTSLNWFQPTAENTLPIPWVLSISVWYYRLSMLAWALWLATALIQWLKWGWDQYTHQGAWKRMRRERPKPGTPPPMPAAKT